jgi:hypothetical protein
MMVPARMMVQRDSRATLEGRTPGAKGGEPQRHHSFDSSSRFLIKERNSDVSSVASFLFSVASVDLQFHLQVTNTFQNGGCFAAKARDMLISNLAVLPNGARQFPKFIRDFGCAAHDLIGNPFRGGLPNSINGLNSGARETYRVNLGWRIR